MRIKSFSHGKRDVKVSKSIIILLSLLLFAFLVILCLMTVFGEVRLEWVDELGGGNGFVHDVRDEKGRSIVFFRLCDYANTNGVYRLEMSKASGVGIRWLTLSRFNQKGELVCSDRIDLSTNRMQEKLQMELPDAYAPSSQGEILVFEFIFAEGNGIDLEPLMYIQRSIKKFKSKKVFHSFSI